MSRDEGIASEEAFGVPTIIVGDPVDEPGLGSATTPDEQEATMSNVWDETESEAADRAEVNEAAAAASDQAVADTEEAQAAAADESPADAPETDGEPGPVSDEAQVPDAAPGAEEGAEDPTADSGMTAPVD